MREIAANTNMRINKYNYDNSLVSSKEIKVNLPNYILEFDDSHPIVNVSENEYHLLKSKPKVKEGNSFSERDFLIEKLRFFIKYDYSLYLKSKQQDIYSIIASDIFVSDIEPPCLPHDIESVEDILKMAVDNEHYEDWNTSKQLLWTYYILSELGLSWTTFYALNRNNLDLIESLKRKYFKGSDKDEIRFQLASRYRKFLQICHQQSVLCIFGAFKNRINKTTKFIPSSYNSLLTHLSFEDDEFVATISKLLYETKEKNRSNIYGVICANNTFVSLLSNPSEELNFYVQRIVSPEYVCNITKNDVLDFSILQSPEEKACSRSECMGARKRIGEIKNQLKKRYDSHVKEQNKYIEQQIVNMFFDHHGSMAGNRKAWKEFYISFRRQLRLGTDIAQRGSSAYYYKFLLYNNDNPTGFFEFSDQFVNELLIVSEKLGSIRIDEVLDNIYALDYIKNNAGLIIDDKDSEIDDNFVVSTVPIRCESVSEALDKIIEFLKPILKEKYLEKRWLNPKDDEHLFENKFRQLFSEKKPKETEKEEDRKAREFLSTNILINDPYEENKGQGFFQGFGIRLLCNIIGALTTNKEKTARVFKRRKADPIIRELCEKRKINGWGSYKNYITGYNTLGSTNTKLYKEVITYIQETFKVALDYPQ